MQLCRIYRFEAAHFLPRVPEGHPCRRVHGHSYRVELKVRGPVKEPEGWVLDFAELDGVFRPLAERLDHNLLNEVPGLQNPTCENLARWIWQALSSRLPPLASVRVWETEAASVLYEGDG